ncbi:MAG: GMC family oxidoreductase [Spirochaetes bacterium]|nr:GMC family oxidoreductase [Spirochaetota bacterium]
MSDCYDVIVVGSGPGGATVARGLARAGKRVCLLEKGREHTNLGTYRGALAMFDRFGFFKSKEGLTMLKATTLGGATMVYSGSAAMPPPWLKTKYGIDLEGYADEICRELNVSVLPDEYLGEASASVMAAGNRLGQEWEPMPKFLDVSKFRNGQSSAALTSLGLNYGERWTARDFIRQAADAGTEVVTRAECLEVSVQNGRATGVKARVRGRGTVDYRSDIVVLCAGGIPTPVLLKRAGIAKAGEGCVVDPTVLVYGISPRIGTYRDPLVSVVSWKWYDSDGIRLGTLIDPRLMTLISLAKAGLRHVPKILSYRKMIAILVKVKDELGGMVDSEGRVSKALTEADMAKIRKGIDIARAVLAEAGCAPESIVAGEIRGAHPSGTCRVGEVVDDNLKTAIDNLYVCDASVFPEALDRPTVITIIAFGMRLVDHLLGRAGGGAR